MSHLCSTCTCSRFNGAILVLICLFIFAVWNVHYEDANFIKKMRSNDGNDGNVEYDSGGPLELELELELELDTSSTNSNTSTASKVAKVEDIEDDDDEEEDEDEEVIVKTKSAQGIELKINPNSTVATDIERILHYPKHSMIEIRFKKKSKRRCESPSFLGRISGQRLSMIEWGSWSWSGAPPSEEAEETEEAYDIISGSYSHSFLPPGKYFMEIIVLMCSEIKYEEDFRNICLEDPSKHRITMDDAFIEIEEVLNHNMSEGDADADSSLGQWVYDNNRTISNLPLDEKVEERASAPIITPPPSNLSHLSSPPPLYTRYQAPNCGKDWKNHTRCIPIMSTDRFEPYRFEWKKDSHNYVYLDASRDDLVNKNTTAKGITTVVCAVGASHSRELVEYFNYHLENSVRVVSSSTLLSKNQHQHQNQTNITANITTNTTQSSRNSAAAASSTALPIISPPEKKPTIKAVHAYAQYPTDVTEGFVKRKIKWQSCTHIVIGLGQWPASYKRHQPTLFPDFEEQMIQAIDNIKKVRQNNPKIYLRSLHSDSIKDIVRSCPPKDWRSPLVIDGYNDILKRLVDDDDDNVLEYLDTNFIIRPMWDSAPDWSHYVNEAGKQEALYILRRMISSDSS